MLTDNEYKSSNAYAFLKEVSREVYSQVPRLDSDIENANLNQCKDAISRLMNGAQD